MTRANKNSAPSQRMLRVGELVRHALSKVLQRGDIMDPVIEAAVITVPEVRMSPDLKLAKIYIMPLGGEGSEAVVKALNSHQKFIRGRVTPILGMKYSPELRFYVDNTFEEASRIEALLRAANVQPHVDDADPVEDAE